jgi:hypothetical protein
VPELHATTQALLDSEPVHTKTHASTQVHIACTKHCAGSYAAAALRWRPTVNLPAAPTAAAACHSQTQHSAHPNQYAILSPLLAA